MNPAGVGQHPLNRQAGLVLFVCLMVLLLLSLLGVSAMQTTRMQEKMSRTVVDSGLAFQAAESAILDGERYLQTEVASVLMSPEGYAFTASTAEGLYDLAASSETPVWETDIWSGASGHRTGAALPLNAASPKYIIELVLAGNQPDDPADNVPLMGESEGDSEGGEEGEGESESEGEEGEASSDEETASLPDASLPVFRITALGFGGTVNARAMLQTTWGQLPQMVPGILRFGRLSWRQLP